VAPRLEGAEISAGCVEVEEEVFEDLGGLTTSTEVVDQGEAICHDPLHDVSPDPVGGPELVGEGVGGIDHRLHPEPDDRPGP